ncbi:hypothetical protein BDV12DRAFT_200831 [Aspergillus spectabilis]
MPTIPPYETAETIRHRKSQYSRFSDTAQWTLFSSLLHPSLTASSHNPDGSIIVSDGFTYIFSNREEYVSFFSRSNANSQSIHVVGPGELEMISEDEVSAVWGVTYQTGSLGAVGGSSGMGGGHYHEVWRRVEGKWVIVSLKLVRAFSKVISAAEGGATGGGNE